MRTKHETIDIYHDEPLPKLDGVVVFTENEYGMASLLAGTTIIGDREPDAVVMSHLLSELAFNAAPKMARVGWEIYFEKNHCGDTIAFVMLTNWPNVQLFPPESSKATWIYTYPTVRDLVLGLQELGAKEMRFLSSTTIHEALDNDTFALLSPKTIKNYVYGSDSNEDDNLFFSPPTWLFPYLAHKIGYDWSEIIMSGCDDDKKVDDVAGWTLAGYLSDYMGNKLLKRDYNKIVKDFNKLVTKHEKLHDDMVENMKAVSEAQTMAPSEHMWG
jgi:hypothetical protein